MATETKGIAGPTHQDLLDVVDQLLVKEYPTSTREELLEDLPEWHLGDIAVRVVSWTDDQLPGVEVYCAGAPLGRFPLGSLPRWSQAASKARSCKLAETIQAVRQFIGTDHIDTEA